MSSLATTISKVQKLIALAVNSAAAPGEAANAAIAACRLIASNGLTIVAPTEQASESTWKMIRSRFEQTCGVCSEPIAIGERVAWQKGRPVVCQACVERARSRAA